jgi:minor extracellular serine protease Vpr
MTIEEISLMYRIPAWIGFLTMLAPMGLLAGGPSSRYALVLQDAPVASGGLSTRIVSNQRTLRSALRQRGIRVNGSVSRLMNAVFVQATPEQEAALRALPGVQDVLPLPRLRPHMNRAVDLANVRSAWTAVGGVEKAGLGIKIGILDSGIDHEHPAFTDSSLTVPSGYPKCATGDCAYTNHKIIVARSYVSALVAGDTPAISRPDDLSPRDRNGHGTAVAMIAAGNSVSSPLGTLAGVAPKAFLGNYKIAGSPGVNDATYGDVVIAALEDAVNDGMDVVVLDYGYEPVFDENGQSYASCWLTRGTTCDPIPQAIEAAVQAGTVVVVSAGNSGDLGYRSVSLNTIQSPGNTPSAITVGASSNSHVFYSSVSVTASGAPAELTNLPALFGNGPRPLSKLTAPLRDVAQLGNDGLACSALSSGSLTGALALIQRGNCDFSIKAANAQNAGAVGVVLYQSEGIDTLFEPVGLNGTGIPLAFIGNTNGKKLKSFLTSHADAAVTLDPSLTSTENTSDIVAAFSSRGPVANTGLIKPELVAPGLDLYTATQKLDPNSLLYDATGYTAVQGTSFSAAMVAGAAALVKQQHSTLTPAQIKSVLVDTANNQIEEYVDGSLVQARVVSAGGGRLSVADALKSTVTVTPSTLSYGVLTSSNFPPQSIVLTVTNIGSSAVTLSLGVTPRTTGSSASITLNKTTLALNAGASATVTASLVGTLPSAGSYEGVVSIQGGGATLQVPYLYLRSDATPYDIRSAWGDGYVGLVSEAVPTWGGFLVMKLTDRYGVPVPDATVTFRSTLGGGTFGTAVDNATDIYGIAAAYATLGPTAGAQQFTAEAGGLSTPFNILARNAPAIATGGVLDAASGIVGQGLAPGSYISIYGSNLSESLLSYSTPYLPLSLANVSVSFDVPSMSTSVPGHLHFVSPNQINVQIPWELAGLSSAQMKVSIGWYSSAIYNVPLNDYAPAFFEYPESSTGRSLIAALDESYNLATSSNPVLREHIAQMYVNGLGPLVDGTQPASGEIAPVNPLAWTKVRPTVTIGGKAADTQYWGLAPYFVGLYQLNVKVPADVTAGIQPVVITVNGVSSKAASLPVK